MKKTIYALVALLIVVFLSATFGCADSDDSNVNTTSETSTSLIVEDADGTSLGLVLSADSESITILSSEKYIYVYDWIEFQKRNIYYTNGTCSGAAYDSESTKYGKSISINNSGDVFIPTNLNADGSPATSLITSESYIDQDTGSCMTDTYNGDFIELTPTTKAAVGIPDTIALPLTIKEK